jgi:hypothetical protein
MNFWPRNSTHYSVDVGGWSFEFGARQRRLYISDRVTLRTFSVLGSTYATRVWSFRLVRVNGVSAFLTAQRYPHFSCWSVTRFLRSETQMMGAVRCDEREKVATT